MFALNFRRGSDERLVDRVKLDRKLFKQAKRVQRFGEPGAALDDVEKFSPIDPIESRAAAGLFLVVKSALNNLPPRFAVKKADQRKAIENELFAHDAPLPGVRDEGLELRKTAPLKNP